MTKRTFNLNLLVLSLSLFFFNCQPDENNFVHKKHIDSNVKEERGNFNSFNLSQITNRLRIFEKSLNYRSTEDNFTFYIDTTNILKLKNEFSETYTLKVSNENTPENSFQNIVLVSQPNKNPRAFLYTYFPDDSFKSNILININTPFSGRTTVVELDYTRINLQEEVTCVTTTQTLCDYRYTHVAGETCKNVYQSTSTICLDSGGGSDSGSTIGVGDYGGNYGIGGGTYYGDGGGYNPFLGILTRPEIPYIDNSDILGDVNNAKYNFLLANLNLTGRQIGWLGVDLDKILPLYNYLYNNNTIEGKAFVKQLIQNSILTGLSFDIEKSAKSPANIDFSDIDTTTPEGEKFDCIYNKLKESSTFNKLFEETFGDQTKLNVKFLIQDNLTNARGESINGSCSPTQVTNGNYYNTITINGNILSGTTGLSNILVAKTIIHEYLHAYLNVKYLDINQGTAIPYLTNEELQNLLNVYFNASCPINGQQCQHNFMINEFIPVFQTILSEVQNDLLTQTEINDFNITEIIDANGIILESFNWQNFYKYLAFDGLHETASFQSNISNNTNELTNYNEYRRHAKNSNTNCQ